MDIYKVGSPQGREVLQHHLKAFESKNLWDCWEIRTPDDTIELLTRDDWVVVDDQDGIRPISLQDILANYLPAEAPTDCLNCGNPTGYDGIAALPLGQEDGLCPKCLNLPH